MWNTLSLAIFALLLLPAGEAQEQVAPGWRFGGLRQFLGLGESRYLQTRQKPVFTEVGPEPIPPGTLVSIYGPDVGPQNDCRGREDPNRQEPSVPQPYAWATPDPRIFPTELCGVQVMVNETPAGLLFVGPRQINLKFPVSTPHGTAQVRVVRDGVSSEPVSVRVGPPYIELSLAEPAYVGMPVWIRVYSRGRPAAQYPASLNPMDVGCVDLNVRHDGKLLPRIPEDPRMQEGIFAGVQCGGVSYSETIRPGQIPLHLIYRFEEPGTYEVQTIIHNAAPANAPGRILGDSAWTPIQVLPASADQRAQWLADLSRSLPTGRVEILNDLLPSVLGVPDEASLAIVLHYLHHPDQIVRRYAMHALGYWPKPEADAGIQTAFKQHGPTDVISDWLARDASLSQEEADQRAERLIGYLRASSPVQLRGSIFALGGLALRDNAPVSAPVRERAAAALMDAAEHIASTADEQTVIDFAASVGRIGDARARRLLWDFVQRGIAVGQSLAAIAWQRDSDDLAKLGALLRSPPEGISERDLLVLPNVLRAQYQSEALPYLEAALRGTAAEGIKASCARELILLGHPSGFAFVRNAIEQNSRYESSLVQFIKDQFRELREADDSAILEFLAQRYQ